MIVAMRRTVVTLSVLVASLLVGTALAHAHLDSSEPAHGAAAASGTDAVVLRFTEPVEVAFSTFKVLRMGEAMAVVDVAAQGHDMGHDHGEAGEGADDHDHGHAAAALDPLVEAQAQAIAAAVLADAGFATGLVPALADPGAGAHTEVTLLFAEPLSPGTYVVVWRVLSVDTHASEGHLVFEVAD